MAYQQDDESGSDAREVSISDPSLLSVISKAEIDQQIATAKKYPRSIKRFINSAIEMATLDEQIATECIYALPRREKDPVTGKTEVKMIEGPSARLAEIAHHAWGNCIAGARVIDDHGEFVTAQGVFHDLETNSKVNFEVRRRITNRRGDRFSADMIAVTGNACASIALRNAVFKGIPKAFWSKIYEAARKTVAGDSRTLVNRRGYALDVMQKLGATREMVLEFFGLEGVEDIGIDHLATLQGLANAIKENEVTVEEAFAPKKDDAQPADGKKSGNTAPAGSTTNKAKNALKKVPGSEGAAPDLAAIEALRRTMDKAGVSDNAMLQKYGVGSLDELTREHYEDAMRFCNGLLVGPTST